MNLAEILKILRFSVREYKADIFWLFITGFLTNWLLNFTYYPLHFSLFKSIERDYDIFPLSLAVFQILFWIISYLFLRMLWKEILTLFVKYRPSEYGFNYKKQAQSKNRQSPLVAQRFLDDFIFQGNVKPVEDGLIVTNSPAGCLIKPRTLGFRRNWLDFEVLIEAEFPKQERETFNDYLGIVFRAQNFDDYFMLEVCCKNNDLVIRPHVRVNVNWDAPYLDPDFNRLNNFFGRRRRSIALKIKVKGSFVEVTELKTNRTLVWYLPTHVEPNQIQAVGSRAGDNLSKTYVGEVYFRDKAGMFGFRNYGNELAFIKSLHITGN